MATNQTNLGVLLDEYETLVDELGGGLDDQDIDWSKLEALLIRDSEWTERGASELINVVRDYGSFFLRNAAALALALGTEDGTRRL
jgi:hypothetical protein